MSSLSAFKVVVVGGGPVGLLAAHALTRAGIDFVMLERRPTVVEELGASLVLNFMGLRILYQLGLFDDMNTICTPSARFDRVNHQGQDIGDMLWFQLSKQYTGIYPSLVQRQDLTRVLYETLPAESKAKIFTNKHVSTISSSDDDDGVTVQCDDDTSYEGSIVIGADGVHSKVRGEMRRLALEAGDSEVNDEKPFLTSFRCLLTRFPTSLSEDIQAGTTCESHGSGCTSQLFGIDEGTLVAVYEKLDTPTRNRIRWTQEDQETLIERWGHMRITPRGKLTLREAFENRSHSFLVSLEEGVVDHWSSGGRMVLVGDAAHKFTPSTGAGCNNGFIDIAVLVNKLRKGLVDAQEASGNADGTLNSSQLGAIFQDYENARKEAAVRECARSGRTTSMAAWSSSILKILDQWVFSSHRLQRYMFGKRTGAIAQSPMFDFIEAEKHSQDSVLWAVPPRPKDTIVN